MEKYLILFYFVSTMLFANNISTNGYPLIFKCDNYKVYVSPKQAWTPSCIYYKGIKVGLDNGYYGTVIRKSPTVFTGSGHTEGGSENVTNITVYLDGEQQNNPTPGTVYSGTNFCLVKLSRLDKSNLRWTLKVDNNGITESVSIITVDKQPMIGMYAFMHPLFTNTTSWIAEDSINVYKGTCDSKGGWLLRKDIKSLVLYSPNDQLAIQISYPEIYYTDKTRATTIWNLERYHKVYFQPLGKVTLKQGVSYSWQMHFKCFNATKDEWSKYTDAVNDKIKLTTDRVLASQDCTVNPAHSHGGKEQNLVVRGKASAKYSRKSWIRFDLQGKKYRNDAPAKLEVTYIDSPGYNGKISVYGLKPTFKPENNILDTNWKETEIDWYNAPGNSTNTPYKTDYTVADCIAQLNLTNEVNVTNGSVLTIPIDRLSDFLQPDETITFMITSYDYSKGTRCHFASKDNTRYSGPTLTYIKKGNK